MDETLMIPSYFGGYGPPARFRQRKKPVEASNYDFRAARTLKTPNSILDSVTHMLMCALGTGLVTLHSAYMECGIWTALVMNLVLSSGVGYCACILVWTAQKMYGRVQVPQLSYPDLVEAVVLLSPWPRFRKVARCLRYTVELTIALNLYGSCCVFVVMIARNLKELVDGNDIYSDNGDPPLKMYIMSLMIPCVVVCMATDLKYLAPFALIADLYSVLLVLVTIWYSLKKAEVSPLDRPGFKSVMGCFEFSSVCVFILDIASMALPLENNMDEPKKFHFVILRNASLYLRTTSLRLPLISGPVLTTKSEHRVEQIAMPILTAMMMTIGFFGYWNYGEASIAPITVHFPFSPFPIQLKVFLCLVLYVTFAICFYVAFDIEWFYLKRNHQVSYFWLWERLYRTIHVVIIIVISYQLPNVMRMMGIIGAFCTCPTILVFPPFLQILVDWEYPGFGRYKWRLWRLIVLATLGLTVVFGGTYYNIKGLLLEMNEKNTRMMKRNLNNSVSFKEDYQTLFGNDTYFDNYTFFDNSTYTIFS